MYIFNTIAICVICDVYMCFTTHVLLDMKDFLCYFWDKMVDCNNMVKGNKAKVVKIVKYMLLAEWLAFWTSTQSTRVQFPV